MAESEKDFTVHSYLEYLSNKKLMGSKCKKCGQLYAPPRKLCIKCNTANMEWMEFSGNGEVAAFSCIGVGTKFFADKGYSIRKPYCFSVIKLSEGPMISGQLIGINEIEVQKTPPAQIIGKKVKVSFIETPIEGDKPRVDLGFEPI
ncbi:MAG: Zn-ribbon domain-containing OB-fold protein [Promethearchaeota archaeon]|nr:MAG: Zn-ribbon domain-containing OB-fold protein [Candidatus Lokiarchaeota archaeon]